MRTFLSVLGTIFLAELGDKTQLAVLAYSARGGSRLTLLAAASLGIIAASALAVFLGAGLTRVIPVEWVRVLAGTAFVVVGVLLLFDSLPGALRS